MKVTLVLSLLSVLNYSYGGLVPASTTLLRTSSSIVHPSSPLTYYSQQHAPVAYAYRAPLAYSSYAVAPSVYAHQQQLAPAYYAHYVRGPVIAQHQLLAHQNVIEQHPTLIAQNPVAVQYPAEQAIIGQYPVEQAPIGQYPVEQAPIGQYPGGIQGPSQDGSFVIEAADNPQSPPSQPPFQPPQQQPISSGGSPGTTSIDDDTVTVEAS